MLSIKDITILYGGSPVVENFSLEVGKGEIVGLVGESGSGKTTVIRTVMGLLPANGKLGSGSITFDGMDLSSLSARDWLKLRGIKMAMIFQDSGASFNPVRTIGSQAVEYVCEHEKMSKDAARKRIAEMLVRMKLQDPERIMASYGFELSGGQRQRVGIALGMMFNPQLLLGDEPTSALDVTTQAEIVRQMVELRDTYGTSMIVVTHNLGVAANMCDKIVVMKNGKCVESGTREQVIDNPQHEYARLLIDSVPVMRGEHDGR